MKPRFNWNWVLVAIVTSISIFIPVTCQVYIFHRWLTHRDPNVFWTWVGVPFNLGMVLVWTNYALACAVRPGAAPKSWRPTVLTPSDFVLDRRTPPKTKQQLKELLEQRVYLSKKRFCSSCQAYKPPRAHHCSAQRQCVLKMDHYCPWTNNTIGHYNYGHFVRFLVSMCCMILYCLTLIALRIWGILRYDRARFSLYTSSRALADLYVPAPTPAEVVYLIVNILLLLGLCVTAGILTGFQLLYIGTNRTTIESLELDRMERWASRSRFEESLMDTFPYSVGVFRNFCSVFGPRWYLWWLPQPMRGDGLAFPVRFEGSSIAVALQQSGGGEKAAARLPKFLWPPAEYFAAKDAERRGWSQPPPESVDADDSDTEVSSDDDYESHSDDDHIPVKNHGGHAVKETKQRVPEPREHVRRSSEGYVVREISWTDRARMVDRLLADEGVVPPSPTSLVSESSGTESYTPTVSSPECSPARGAVAYQSASTRRGETVGLWADDI